jgi:hypothetical protein
VLLDFADSFLAGALSFEGVVASFGFVGLDSEVESALGDEDSVSEVVLSEPAEPTLAFFESRLSVL